MHSQREHFCVYLFLMEVCIKGCNGKKVNNGTKQATSHYLNQYCVYSSPGALLQTHGWTLIPAWISNCIHHKVWEITYPSLNFNGPTLELWITNFIPHFTVHAVIYPFTLGLKLIHISLLLDAIRWTPDIFPLVAIVLKQQKIPKFLHISAQVWGHWWYLQTWEQ